MNSMSLIYLYAAHMIGYWGSVAVCTRLYPRNVTVFALWCALEVIKNQVLFTPLIAGPLFYMWPESLDFRQNAIWQFPVMFVMSDVIFYHFHRLFHLPGMFQYHKKHHVWSRPLGMLALYADAAEHCIVNTVPPLLAAMLVKADFGCLLIWISLISVHTVISHSSEGEHYLHHRDRKVNFGTGFKICDRLYGTYKAPSK